jgi:hypothetical protein
LIGSAEVIVECTDPSFVNRFLTALADAIGDYCVSAYKFPADPIPVPATGSDRRLIDSIQAVAASTFELSARDRYLLRLYGFGVDLEEVWWLTVQRFYEYGWELVGTPSVSREDPESVLGFALRGDAQTREPAWQHEQRTCSEL